MADTGTGLDQVNVTLAPVGNGKAPTQAVVGKLATGIEGGPGVVVTVGVRVGDIVVVTVGEVVVVAVAVLDGSVVLVLVGVSV
jgi:hypothetical protein